MFKVSYQGKLMKANRGFVRALPYILVYIFASMIIGLGQFITTEFDWRYLVSPEYIFNVSTNTVANIMVLVATALAYITDARKSNEKVIAKTNNLNDITDKYVQADFDDFLNDVFNIEKKKKAYRRIIQLEINKLDPLNEKHDNKIKKLRGMLTKEYINEHIENIRVRYQPISRSFVISGYNVDRDDEYFVQNGALKIFKDLAPRFIISIIYTSFFAAFALKAAEDGVAVIEVIELAIKFFILTINMFLGRNYADQYVEEKIIYDLDMREAIIKWYMSWKVNKKKAGGVSNGEHINA